MNKELEKYIKKNLKKKNKPLFSFLSDIFPKKKIKKILFDKELIELVEEDTTHKTKGFIDKEINEDEKEIDLFKKIDESFDEKESNDDTPVHTGGLFKKIKNINFDECYDVDDYIKENINFNSFQTLLFKMIDERGLTDADVYNKVHIDRRLFHKIRTYSNYHPSKETVILLGLSLKLSEKEIDELLSSASISLPKNNYYDLIIRFCFVNGIYELIEVNDLLDQYNCELFHY